METKPTEQKIDAVVFLQSLVNRSTKAGLFETASEAMVAQQCINAVSNRLEELTSEVEQLNQQHKVE